MVTPVEVRAELVNALRLDLVGPGDGHPFAAELLPEAPTRWYLTGFLAPVDAPLEQRTDVQADDELDLGGDAEGADDGSPPDRAAARRQLMPSSMGLSVLVGPDTPTLTATVCWGDYLYEGAERGKAEPAENAAAPTTEVSGSDQPPGPPADGNTPAPAANGYRRTPRQKVVDLPLPAPGQRPASVPVPDSGGLELSVSVRAVADDSAARLPKGSRAVSVFLVNRRAPDAERRYRAFAFQTCLSLRCPAGAFVGRPDLRATATSADWDEQVSDLQFRGAVEFAVGHNVSARATREPAADGGAGGLPTCRTVHTEWLPTAEVERVAPSTLPGIELEMEVLGALTDGADAHARLGPMVPAYRAWIANQRTAAAAMGLGTERDRATGDLLLAAEHAAGRIAGGIDLLARDPVALEAFRLANRTMARAARQRDAAAQKVALEALPAPAWRPFQLAFLLMTLRGIAEPGDADREVVDLLFFPTGGGKTEAYLGLAAFTMVLRRLRQGGNIRSAGLAVLMRYTLRLLTLDQLGRAATLVCALELERVAAPERLGKWPFEIGLWVGGAATPNRMGYQGYEGPGKEETAYLKTRRFNKNSQQHPAPIPIEECPWCGTKFEGGGKSFRLVPNEKTPLDLRVTCVNHRCPFSGDRPLPIVAVDEPIYRRLPAFLIATVDKFAALPWTGEAGTLLGHVARHDGDGFYGPCKPGVGAPLGGPLRPPELVIQDELHLISGPLGTVAGVYETAIEALASRPGAGGENGPEVRPKIIASTATVRRADRQIRALFGRPRVEVFPPPGPDRRDSFFAHTQAPDQTPARLYVGITAQGRSLKVVLLRSALALLCGGQAIYDREGGAKNPANPADPYMTLLGYFNTLRELGGSRRIMEDEVNTRATQYGRRRRREPEDRLFRDRHLDYDVLELTSRVSTNAVAAARRRLGVPYQGKERVDVALATNMISVGLDILRLGLMVVLGQPKTSAEYIQATSRVGRDPARPGLIVTLLNVHKPRDRSHYERFESYHETFYRSVEATSVTPFSPRALDRALAASLVALCRQGTSALTPPGGAGEIRTHRAAMNAVAERFAERAASHDASASQADAEALRQVVRNRARRLLDDWCEIADQLSQTHTALQYQREVIGGGKQLLREFLDPELAALSPTQRKFRANRSMRDVERSVDLTIKSLQNW